MQIGRVADIDNAQLNNIEKSQKVRNVDEKARTISDDEYKKNLSKMDDEDLNEVLIDNVKFGYNTQSKDFFVKVTRGDAEYKYPTEDMMRVKALLLQELERENKTKN